MSVTIAAPHPAALQSARRAAESGGNAIDAALAAAIALTVVYPHQCGLGGDLVALVRRPDGTVRAVVSVGAAPAGIDVESLGDAMPSQGAQTVTVPGVVAGWRTIADLGAELPLGPALRRAGRIAAEGTPVSPGLARAIQDRRRQLLDDDGLAAVFGDGDGGLLGEGDVLRQPALARTLAELAEDPAAFYRGRIAVSVTDRLRTLGGAMTPADLAAHRAEIVDPIVVDRGGARWWVAPPPTQGVVLLGVLPEALARDTERMVGVFRDALLTRTAELGDPRGGEIRTDAMLEPSRSERQEVPSGSRQLGDTVAVVAAGTDGTVVTLIQSLYQSFGSGILDPGTGVVLHNRGSAFSTDPAHPAHVGPGLRPPHTLLPVVAETGELRFGLGCQGGGAQPWILAQVAADLLDPTADPEEVLGRSRFVLRAGDRGLPEVTLVAEPGLDDARAAARRLGLAVTRASGRTDEAGHVQVVRVHSSGRVDAASDPRADGGTTTCPIDRST